MQRELTISKSVTSSRLHVTGLGIVMLFKDAIFKRNVTDSGIATVTTRLHSLKAPAGISVIEDGMLTWMPSAWMASFVAASTSFLPRRPTNASVKGRNAPFGAGVCHFGLGMQQPCKLQCGSSCTNSPFARIWRSMGSRQCFFSGKALPSILQLVFSAWLQRWTC